jgi:7-keto-8-aminopelargonate synthetase-like enzyme
VGEIEQRLAELEHAGLSRHLRLVAGAQGPRVLLDGDPVLLLCSNNYLGLADHPLVREAASRAALAVWGGGGEGGVGWECARERNALLHAAGELVRIAVDGV